MGKNSKSVIREHRKAQEKKKTRAVRKAAEVRTERGKK